MVEEVGFSLRLDDDILDLKVNEGWDYGC
jgi:hypothetical protein